MCQKRVQRNQTVQEFIQVAVVDELPRLVESLSKLQIKPSDPEARPAKLPLDERLLASLKKASSNTGLPQSRLLIACLGTAFAGAERVRMDRSEIIPFRMGRGRSR